MNNSYYDEVRTISQDEIDTLDLELLESNSIEIEGETHKLIHTDFLYIINYGTSNIFVRRLDKETRLDESKIKPCEYRKIEKSPMLKIRGNHGIQYRVSQLESYIQEK